VSFVPILQANVARYTPEVAGEWAMTVPGTREKCWGKAAPGHARLRISVRAESARFMKEPFRW
jgi:hypothetical protein